MKCCTGFKRFFIAPLILAALAGFSFITMLLWNAILPEILHLPLITFWQAAGLLILSRLLFGFNGPRGGGHHHHNPHHRGDFREKFDNLNPQEREEFKRRWYHHRCSCSDVKDHFKKEENTEI